MGLVGRDGLQQIFCRIDRLVYQEAMLVLQVLPAAPMELAGRSQLGLLDGDQLAEVGYGLEVPQAAPLVSPPKVVPQGGVLTECWELAACHSRAGALVCARPPTPEEATALRIGSTTAVLGITGGGEPGTRFGSPPPRACSARKGARDPVVPVPGFSRRKEHPSNDVSQGKRTVPVTATAQVVTPASITHTVKRM